MDSYSPPTDERAHQASHSGKLRKKSKQGPPPVSFHNHASNSSLLRRAPSAPTYPSFNSLGNSSTSSFGSRSPIDSSSGLGAFHQQPTSTSTSTSTQPQSQFTRSPSLNHQHSRSPILPPSIHAPSAASSQGSLTLVDKRDQRDPLIGSPFDAASILSQTQAINTSTPSSLSSAAVPPRPLIQHSHTTDSKKWKSPKQLRQSASFTSIARTMDTITPPRSTDSGTKSPRQRYSDEVKNRKSDGGKKKTTFSSFVNSMLGSPRRPTISTPTNPMHVTHVSIDNETGEYTVSDTLSCQHCTAQFPTTPI